LSPYIQKIRETLATLLEIPVQNINVKAKTNEGMGFIGRKEGITSISVALIRKA